MKKQLWLFAFLFIIVFGFLGNVSQAYDLGVVDIHGFISQGYLKSDENNYLGKSKDGTFEFNELGLNFSTRLSAKLRVGLQLFARDLGDLGNDEVTIDWAFADYKYQDWLGLRVGKLKVPFGLYWETRDMDMLRTCIILPTSIYMENYRETISSMKGLGIYGDIPAGPAGSLNYSGQVGVWNMDTNGGVTKAYEDLKMISVDDYKLKTSYFAALAWEIPFGLKIKGSLYDTAFDIQGETGDNEFYGGFKSSLVQKSKVTAHLLSVEYTWGNLILATEYAIFQQEYLTEMPGLPDNQATQDTESYYVSAAYRFTDWFELGTYYSVFYPNTDNKDGEKNAEYKQYQWDGTLLPKYSQWTKDFALSTRFDVTESWIVKLEGHIMNGTNGIMVSDNIPYSDVKEDWFLFAAKVSYSF